LDRLDREFNLLAASARRTACVQRDEVKRFLDTAPRHAEAISSAAETSSDVGARAGEPRRGSILAKHLHGAYDALIAHVEQRTADYQTLPDEKAKTGALVEMRQMVAGARSLHRSLSWLDAAGNPPLDLGTRYLVDQTTARLVVGHAEVTVVAATDRSYATVTNPLGPVFELSGATPPNAEMIIVVFVPRREQRSGLLHPLIIHELGHAANKWHNLVAQVLMTERGREELRLMMSEAREHAASCANGEVGADEVSAAAEATASRLTAWIEEAVCDAIAAHILGPTYLYAFMAIVGTSDLDTAGDEHPTTRQRIRLLLAQLDDLGWTDLLAAAAPEIDTWFREAASKDEKHETPDIAFCAEALSRLSPEIVSVVVGRLGYLVFHASDFAPVRAEINGLLTVGIPPSQTRKRAMIGRAEIILGSWLFAVEEQGGDLDALAVAADVPELSRLLPKALQDAAMLEAWEAQ
jgi:hypothetical protein